MDYPFHPENSFVIVTFLRKNFRKHFMLFPKKILEDTENLGWLRRPKPELYRGEKNGGIFNAIRIICFSRVLVSSLTSLFVHLRDENRIYVF